MKSTDYPSIASMRDDPLRTMPDGPDQFADAFCQAFNKLTEEERGVLLETAERQRFQDGDIIIREGTKIDAVYLVADGHVRVEFEPLSGEIDRKRVDIAKLSRGAVFGEMSFLDQGTASASVVAAGDVDVLCIDAASIDTIMSVDATFAGRFYHSLAIILSHRLRLANNRRGWV